LKSQSFHINLTIIGDGPLKDKLEIQALQIGLENIWLYGSCYDETELSNLIYNADLMVSPGNVGLNAIHAMGYGTPVLTHNNLTQQMPEFEAIQDGITGIFFEYEDIESLVETIKRWFAISLDRNLVRQNCFGIIDSKYNPHIQLETLMNIINPVVFNC